QFLMRGSTSAAGAGNMLLYGVSAGSMDFGTNNTSRLLITNAGNVGIGTTSPGEKLEVNGNIKLTGRIHQGDMGDMAEMMALSPMVLSNGATHQMVPRTNNLAHGEEMVRGTIYDLYSMPQSKDVVMIDNKGGIRLSDAPNSTSVIGVISTNPAHVLMADLENGVPVALSGTVPCKVTTENGPIYPGDLLTSSSKPGYAMKANPPKIGAIIGKAMEALEEGEGEIIVFVTRQ
ncbi:hypothetical protein KKD84_05430, partial [Patescibacteria group bacterium]|nr:hypothetical protein [Patescibacteria group bacterium]